MKHTYKTIAGMLCLAAMPCHSQAQDSAGEEIREAIDILKGKTVGKSAEWAVETLTNAEDAENKPIAQNALGVVYLKGLSVTQDSAKAAAHFETAARLGHTAAYYNLGRMMKDAPRSRQDFARAVQCFEKGAELGNLACIYAAGYMYYKGLGCTQDYRRAVAYFRQDEKGMSPSCQYMLGLCYRNGFGVERNDQKADEMLQKASNANYRFAIEETLRETAEVEATVALSDNDACIPETMPDVEPLIGRGTDLSGSYKGCIITYDWSGRQIVREESLDVTFSKTGGCYSGVWIQGADTLAVSTTMDGDGRLMFADSRMLVSDRYTEDTKIECLFDEASLALAGSSLTGGLRMYSLTHNEPMRPMYLSLNRSAEGTAERSRECALTAYPIPGTGQIEIRFLLPKDVKEAAVSLTDKGGLYAKSYRLGSLSSGEQRITISTSLMPGLYVVTLHADEYHGNTVILLNK